MRPFKGWFDGFLDSSAEFGGTMWETIQLVEGGVFELLQVDGIAYGPVEFAEDLAPVSL